MRNLVLLSMVLVLLGCNGKQEETTRPDGLPNYTDAQRWQRVEFHSTSFSIAIINYAKSKGESVEDVGKYVGAMFAPSWGEDVTPGYLMRGWYRNGAAFSGATFEIVEETDHHVKFRVNNPTVSYFGDDGEAYGLTPADIQAFINAMYTEICDAHGLTYTETPDGDMRLVTVMRR